MYPIRQIDRLQAENIEYLGTKRKFWFTLDGERYLFKAEERGTGEDWAEKVVCELAEVLGIPHVEYHLAHESEGGKPIQPGVICPRFVSRPQSFEMANQLLVQRDPNYPADEQAKYHVKNYSVAAVAAVMADLGPPADEWMTGVPEGIQTALDVFAGYLLLDAWVANQDRHHQNWGAIRDGEKLLLAPTYDHGSSLARNLTDEERKDRLRTKDRNRTVAHFAARARSAFYHSPADKKTLSALEVFEEFANHSPNGAAIWTETLRGVAPETVQAVLNEVPPQRMTPITCEFTFELLMINQQRLLKNSLKP
ncbi:MAG: HipA domain-containing protein [Luteolibacter sp.]